MPKYTNAHGEEIDKNIDKNGDVIDGPQCKSLLPEGLSLVSINPDPVHHESPPSQIFQINDSTSILVFNGYAELFVKTECGKGAEMTTIYPIDPADILPKPDADLP